MKTVEFRKLEKEMVKGRVPKSLEHNFRKEATRKRTSLSALLTLFIANGLGEDPSRYGIAPSTRKAAS